MRRYYIAEHARTAAARAASTRSLPGVGLPRSRSRCPGNNFGTGVLPANPVPHTETFNALRVHFRDWVMKQRRRRRAAIRRCASSQLVDADKAAIGFPDASGACARRVPEPDFIIPVLDYDWGREFDPIDASGVPTTRRRRIRQVIRMLVPQVDADGNEVGGVPMVLLDAPLGTYLGWNITAGGTRVPQGPDLHYAGGMIPFAQTQAERIANGDPRLSLRGALRQTTPATSQR